MCVLGHVSCVQLFETLWAVVCQAPPSMGFSRQDYWSGLLCPPSGALPNAGMATVSPVTPALQADPLPLSHILPSVAKTRQDDPGS